MQASNNSPLPKGDLNNQELKTKGTIWKPLIAVSLLSVFSFTAGQYLPYVIAAVSGSGAIAAVPLAISAVSTVVALVLATYLIKLAVSRASNKKNDTNLENKSSVPTPLTLGTAIPQKNNASAPPPPPPLMPTPEQLNLASGAARESSANTTGEKPYVGAIKEDASPAKKFIPPKDNRQVSVSRGIIMNARANLKRPVQPNNSIDGQQGSVKGSDAVESNKGTDKDEALAARIEREQKERKQLILENIQGYSCLGSILARRTAMEFSDNDDEDDDQDRTSGSEWEDKYSTSPTPQSDGKKRSESPDSGNISGDEGQDAGQTPPYQVIESDTTPPLPLPVLPKLANYERDLKLLL